MTSEHQTSEPTRAKKGRVSRKVDYRDPSVRRKAGEAKGRLHADIPEGLQGRWVIDEPGRVQSFIERGWKFAIGGQDGSLEEADGRSQAIHVPHSMADERGESVKQYLMLIPQELFDEDRQALWDKHNVIESQMQDGPYGSDLGNAGYVASEGVTLPKGKG